ncbi:hypothetical protein F3A76_23980, partial [Salmonella enterica subsp. enterica serovar Typhi]|nr:hypothetical protein [Salmonella enterica subsp. enterica serovar Typhi]
MRRYIWDSPKERQVSFLNNLFSWSTMSMTKGRYRMIKKVFESNSGISLDDLKPIAIKRFVMKLFYFKFEASCSNAKYVRCGKKKGYEDTEFLLGNWSSLIWNLKQNRPDLMETGLSICEKYIRNGFNNDDAPVLHRKSDKGHYAWDNIEIMTRKAHDELTK